MKESPAWRAWQNRRRTVCKPRCQPGEKAFIHCLKKLYRTSSQKSTKNQIDSGIGMRFRSTVMGIALRIHVIALRPFFLYVGGDGFSGRSWIASIPRSTYREDFGRDRNQVMRALDELVECDWAEVIHKEALQAGTYSFQSATKRWARSHPTCCIVKYSCMGKARASSAQQLHTKRGGLAKFLNPAK